MPVAIEMRDLRSFSALFGLARGYIQTQIAAEPLPLLLMDGERVSSTLIRERLLLGDLVKAEAFLGRPYSLVGKVVPGRHIG